MLDRVVWRNVIVIFHLAQAKYGAFMPDVPVISRQAQGCAARPQRGSATREEDISEQGLLLGDWPKWKHS